MTDTLEHLIKAKRRGRPKSDSAQIASKRAPILQAAAHLLSTMHSNQITVDHLIEIAKISRPTFYRWFPQGVDQVVDFLIAEANQDLVQRLQTALIQHTRIEDKIRETIRMYFSWCVDSGPVISGIYREGFDEKSSAYRYRMQTRQFAMMLLQNYVQHIQIQNIQAIGIETMISWIESAAITLCAHTPYDQHQLESQVNITTAMFLGTLDRISSDWRERVKSYEQNTLMQPS